MTTDPAIIGHNSVLNGNAQSHLRSIVERIERLNTEKDEISELIKEVFAEAKGNGFDVAVLRLVIARRKKDRAKLQEQEAILDLYLAALGELPLFEAAVQAGAVITPEIADNVMASLNASEADPSILENEAATDLMGAA